MNPEKENIIKVSEYCSKKYKENYGEQPEDEYWTYMVSEYYGTGEGHTICLLLTQALPSEKEDFGEQSYGDYLTTQEYRAVREFMDKFGIFYCNYLEFLNKEDFFTKYANAIPPFCMKLKDAQCYKSFFVEMHFNYS